MDQLFRKRYCLNIHIFTNNYLRRKISYIIDTMITKSYTTTNVITKSNGNQSIISPPLFHVHKTGYSRYIHKATHDNTHNTCNFHKSCKIPLISSTAYIVECRNNSTKMYLTLPASFYPLIKRHLLSSRNEAVHIILTAPFMDFSTYIDMHLMYPAKECLPCL